MTISTEEHMQDVIRGDMLQLNKLLEICNVPKGKAIQIKEVVTRAITRGSDYGYRLGLDDSLKDGERTKHYALLNDFEILKQRYDQMKKTNRRYASEISHLKDKIYKMESRL